MNNKYMIPDEDTNDNKINLDKYIEYYKKGEGNTIYDLFARKIKYTDFSDAGLLKLLRNGYVGNKVFTSKSYEEYFKRIMIPLVGDKDGLGIKMTPEIEQVILNRINKIVKNHNHVPTFYSVSEYAEYAFKNYSSKPVDATMPPELEELHDVLVESALAFHTDRKELTPIRHQVVTNIIIKEIKSNIAKNTKYTSLMGGVEKKDASQDPEWNFYNNLLTSLNFPSKLYEYDRACSEFQQAMDKKAAEEALRLRCERTRSRVVENELGENLGIPKDVRLEDANIFSNVGVDSRVPRENSYQWRVREFRKPQVLLNERVRYSADGESDQKVIAVSYGNFEYGAIPNGDHYTYTSNLLNVVGITRCGKEGEHTYFVLSPLNEGELRKVQPGMKVKGEPTFKSQQGDYFVLKSEKILESNKDFYSAIVFSDEYLDLATKGNFSCLGMVDKDGKLDLSSFNSYDVTAAKYAMSYGGLINGARIGNINEYLQSALLRDKHMKVVDKVLKAEREKSKKETQKSTEEGIEI